MCNGSVDPQLYLHIFKRRAPRPIIGWKNHTSHHKNLILPRHALQMFAAADYHVVFACNRCSDAFMIFASFVASKALVS